MRTLITGSNGFIAKYLIDELRLQKNNVTGIVRKKSSQTQIVEKVGDITNQKFVQKVIYQEQPDIIFHLAAQSNIPYSFEHPEETFNTNITGTLHFLEAIKASEIHFLSVGSSAEYGATARDNHSLTEDSVLEPSSPYALSKMTQGKLVSLYKKAYGIHAVHVRPFAVIGPGKKGDALSDFAKGIAQIEKGQKEYLEVGDISVIRDFIDVRDAVRAMTLITKKDSPEIVNICLGKGKKLSTILDLLISHAKTKIPVKMNKIAKRPMDDAVLLGDPTKLFTLGFKPQISLEQSIQEILDYWRNTI